MGIRVRTNIGALNAQRHLFNTTNKFHKSMEKLSSGMRINRAGDDAAGLAISESLRSDIRALQQASRNAADGIGLVQVGEGALDETSNILIRMKELAEQSINGTLGPSERGYLDAEYQALISEIDRISAATEFNGVFLLSGAAGPVDIQVGIGSAATDRVQIDLSSAVDAATLGVITDITTAANAMNAMAEVDIAIATVSGVRGDFGAVQNRLETSIRNIGSIAENLSAANSRIRDVDMAIETSNMTSYQILQQAGVSILTQANMSSQLALALLQG